MSFIRKINQTVGDLLFSKWNETKKGDNEILHLIDKAEIVLKFYPKEGIRYLKDAEEKYKERGYNFEICCAINKVTKMYIQEYLKV
ncbi:hypothetical protein KY314_03750 [Candidatus Woesearchaeota archaeon]|nr:hypothetical protein [Candidatus Woesearchaeota archaeon]